jgi:hypothetical protein
MNGDRDKLSGRQMGQRATSPLIVGSWRAGAGRVIQMRVGRHKAIFTIDIRVWSGDPRGQLRPGRDGITLPVHHLRQLARQLNRAHRRAQELGLIGEDGSESGAPIRSTE